MMVSHFSPRGAGRVLGSAEGWLMQLVRLLDERLARPRYFHPDELSPHLRRDVGLMDGYTPDSRSRP